jgi:hypothetical protein
LSITAALDEVAADRLAILHQQVMADAMPGAVIAEAGEPGIGGLMRREVLG